MRDVLRVVNGLVRPVCVFSLLATTIALAVKGHERATEVLVLLLASVVSFYFGERSALKQTPPPVVDAG